MTPPVRRVAWPWTSASTLNPAQQEVLAPAAGPGRRLARVRPRGPAGRPARPSWRSASAPLVDHLGRPPPGGHQARPGHGARLRGPPPGLPGHLRAGPPPPPAGTVAHKAVELWVHWRGSGPRATWSTTPSAGLTESDYEPGSVAAGPHHGRPGRAAGPPPSWWPSSSSASRRCAPAWRPVTETPPQPRPAAATGSRLSGKVDLALGAPQGRRAGKVIIDLKTGSPSAPATATTSASTPWSRRCASACRPLRVATYYLDAGRAVVEEVTVELLHTAMRAPWPTAPGGWSSWSEPNAHPGRRAGPTCWWCPLQEDSRRRGRAGRADDSALEA